MKYKTLISACALAAAGFAMAAQAPEIETGRIDSMVAQVMKQADADSHATQRPDGAVIRKNVITQLQSFEIMKNEALKAGLDKNPEVQNELKNLEAQFYAAQYAAYLERNTEVSDAEVRTAYDQQTRIVKLQQVQFDSADAARSAQELLLKGMSFEALMKRYPNPEQQFNDYISPQQLPPELSRIVGQMTRGQITREPVKLGNQFYIFKLAASERNPEAPPFDAVREQLTQQAKQQKVQQQIETILKNHGL